MKHPIAFDEQIRTAIEAMLRQGNWCDYLGPEISQLETNLASHFAQTYAHTCCTGTIATEIALRGLSVQAADEVILCAYDFSGNFRAVEAIGATAVLVDTSPKTWTISLEAINQAVTDRTRAIIVSHLHGQNAPMKDIVAIAEQRGISVLEDACQNPGAIIDGRPAGAWGTCSTLSFGGSKLLTSGRGGAVLTSNERISQRMRVYRNQGNDAFAMSQLQACVLIPQLAQLESLTQLRSQAIQTLESQLHGRYSWLSIPELTSSDTRAYYKWGFFVVNPSDQATDSQFRDTVIARLSQESIPVGTGFLGLHRRVLKQSQRCRSSGALDCARFASEATVVLHHAILLEPSGWIDKLLETLDEIDRAYA